MISLSVEVKNIINVGTLLAFIFFFFFRWRPMFSSYFVCGFIGVGPSASMCVPYGRIDIFLHVIILPDAASSVV